MNYARRAGFGLFRPLSCFFLPCLTALIALFLPLPSAAQSSEAPAERVIQRARSFWGTPHARRARGGIDCSGLVVKSFAAIDLPLARTSRQQALQGIPVERQHLRKGDLVFFWVNGRIGHVGIVVSSYGQPVRFIHTSASKGVKEDALDNPFWNGCYATARRVLPPPAATPSVHE